MHNNRHHKLNNHHPDIFDKLSTYWQQFFQSCVTLLPYRKLDTGLFHQYQKLYIRKKLFFMLKKYQKLAQIKNDIYLYQNKHGKVFLQHQGLQFQFLLK